MDDSIGHNRSPTGDYGKVKSVLDYDFWVLQKDDKTFPFI